MISSKHSASMYSKRITQRGFTLVELVSVMMIVAVIAATAASRLIPSSLMEMQAARDQLIAALFHAQQKALFSAYDVRLTTLAGSIDIRMDADEDGAFDASESIRFGSVQYPLVLVSGIQASTHTLSYSALAETTAVTITLSKDSRSSDIAVSASGFAQ